MKPSKIKQFVTLASLSLSASLLMGCQSTQSKTEQQVSQIQPMLDDSVDSENDNSIDIYDLDIEHLQKLVEQGSAEAQYNLGQIYEIGRDVPQDYERAFKWYEKSANQGFAGAQTQLGLMYRHGRGVNVDHAKAVELLFKAFEQGDEVAHYHLGTIYISNGNPNQ